MPWSTRRGECLRRFVINNSKTITDGAPHETQTVIFEYPLTLMRSPSLKRSSQRA